MSHGFQFVGLDHRQFEPLFDLPDDALKASCAQRLRATASPGFPCRVSLQDASVGDELLLLPHLHQPAASPYRASGPIFVRRGVTQRRLPVGVVPDAVSRRLMSVRAYDAGHAMVDATVCDGSAVVADIERFLLRDDVAYIHLHNATRGCFACRVERA